MQTSKCFFVRLVDEDGISVNIEEEEALQYTVLHNGRTASEEVQNIFEELHQGEISDEEAQTRFEKATYSSGLELVIL